MTSKTWNALWDEYKPRRVHGKKTEPEIIRTFERYVAPILGPKRVDKTTFQMLEQLHQSMQETPYQANRVLALLRPMLKLAGALEWIPGGHNPARAIVAFPERKRRRHLKRVEAPRVAQELLKRERSAPDAALLFWLLIFTGARPSEIKAAYWRDLDGNTITLQDHKSAVTTGVHERIIVIPPAAMVKVDLLKPVAMRHLDQKIIAVKWAERVFQSVRRQAGCPDLRMYDLRHTFASYALQEGFNIDQIGEALAHSNGATTKIYAELTTATRQKLALHSSLAILKDMDVKEYIGDVPKELT